jgi:peptidoglycan hydrolase-like protein with peptidoglycan-binding domain
MTWEGLTAPLKPAIIDDMAITFPSGYGTSTITLQQMRDRHQADYHPEAWRRIEAIAVDSGGILGLNPDQGLCGIGGGARTREEQAASYERAPNTFARPDSSFHQIWTKWASGAKGAQAVDWVGREGRHQEAWKWLRDNGGRFGLITFWNVNGEPWHSQMSDVPNSVSQWKALGYPDPGTWNIEGHQTPLPSAPDLGLWPYNPNKPEISDGSLGDAVEYAQITMRDKAGQKITVDGEYGPQTATAVSNLQVYFNLQPFDSNINKNEWDLLDALNGVHHVAPAPPPSAPSDITAVEEGVYWVQLGDGPWPAAQRVYADGNNWQKYFQESQFSKPSYHIPAPGLAGKTTFMLPGEGPYAVMARLYPQDNVYAPGRLQRFYDLNGSKARSLNPGDLVFLDPPK